jgi:hypothetical protein
MHNPISGVYTLTQSPNTVTLPHNLSDSNACNVAIETLTGSSYLNFDAAFTQFHIYLQQCSVV